MSRLALIGHAGKHVEQAYLDALAPYGFTKVVAFTSPFKGMSSAYVQLGQSLKKNGRILPSLIEKFAPDGPWEKVMLVTWSAAYGLAREMLNVAADVAELDALVMLDSLHSDDAPAAREIQLAPFVRYAQLAKEGRKVFFLGHSDVPTSDYESTTKSAHNLLSRVGGVGGKFLIRAYDTMPGRTIKDYEEEHKNALRLWGPEAAMEAAGLLDMAAHPMTEPPDTTPSQPHPEAEDVFVTAFMNAAKEDLNVSPKEESFNRGRWLEANILSPAGLEPGQPYCAATVTRWLRIASDATGLPMPIPGSNGAQNLMAQFKAEGRWIDADDIAVEEIVEGLVPVWNRQDTSTPERARETAWWGHTAATLGGVGQRSFGNIEGNSDKVKDDVSGKIYAICQTERRLDDPKLFGFGWVGDMKSMPTRNRA